MRSSTATTFDDICIARHGDSAVSNDANRRARESKSKVRAAIYALICALPDATSKELAAKLDKPVNAISGRISELKAAGLVRETVFRRGGCAVLKAVRNGQPALF